MPDYQFRIKYGQPFEPAEMVEHIALYSSEVHYIAPFFIVDIKQLRLMAIKLSLESLIEHTPDMTSLLLCLLSRQNNKRIMMKLLSDMIVNKNITLEGVGKVFTKLN